MDYLKTDEEYGWRTYIYFTKTTQNLKIIQKNKKLNIHREIHIFDKHLPPVLAFIRTIRLRK